MGENESLLCLYPSISCWDPWDLIHGLLPKGIHPEWLPWRDQGQGGMGHLSASCMEMASSFLVAGDHTALSAALKHTRLLVSPKLKCWMHVPGCLEASEIGS